MGALITHHEPNKVQAAKEASTMLNTIVNHSEQPKNPYGCLTNKIIKQCQIILLMMLEQHDTKRIHDLADEMRAAILGIKTQ